MDFGVHLGSPLDDLSVLKIVWVLDVQTTQIRAMLLDGPATGGRGSLSLQTLQDLIRS